MKFTIDVYICDTCEKRVENQTHPAQYGGRNAVADWIMFIGDKQFCSKKCAIGYLLAGDDDQPKEGE